MRKLFPYSAMLSEKAYFGVFFLHLRFNFGIRLNKPFAELQIHPLILQHTYTNTLNSVNVLSPILYFIS